MDHKLLSQLQSAYTSFVPASTRHFIYEHAPAALQRQISNMDARATKLPFTVDDLRLPAGPYGSSRFPRRVNKICDEGDWHGEEWFAMLDALGEPERKTGKHRKAWEWAQGLYALEQLGLLREDATAVGVGAGVENILYTLANRIRMVYATDIYGEGDFIADTAFSDMLSNPARYAKFPYREDHLTVMHMNGLALDFPDNTFDIAFSFSSIEHFGGHEASAQAVREMARVLKPGGALVLVSEVILNGRPHAEFFLPADIQRYLVNGTCLQPIEPIDYTISAQTLAHTIDTSDADYVTQLPHIVHKAGAYFYTSFCLVMEKR
jgi:SAM-dependent methyltransferase